jgi:uncharacterized protein YyaL (SSP411 family)
MDGGRRSGREAGSGFRLCHTLGHSQRSPALRPAVVSIAFVSLALLALLTTAGCALQEGDAGDAAPPKTPAQENRLARETSPYLRAHADNPVDWYPWGPEALEAARTSDKPIFLSIGYSTCHWCHVMEREVFSHAEIARELNQKFICIKIDREERPDLDDLYLKALEVYFDAIGANRSGGWPISLFLTPDGRPLGGGTFIPAEDDGDEIGFKTLLARIHDGWMTNRADLEKNADLLTRGVQTALKPRLVLQPVELTRELVAGVVGQLGKTFDREFGGFGFDPADPDRAKFPNPTKLSLLLYEARASSDPKAKAMVLGTLDAMAAGGLHDQLGGGFHRYSTDRAWRVPHFEKMLYDNAQLLEVYAEAFQLTSDPRYKQLAEETAGFLLRELADVGGGFCSALDAETEGVEGQYYVWTRGELGASLPPAEAALVERIFALGPQPDFPYGHVLRLRRPLVQIADSEGMSTIELERRLATIRTRLLAVRKKRPAPFRDDKVLTAWNGLTIRALARSGRILDRAEFVEAAAKAGEFLIARSRDERGRLLRSYAQGEARAPACLDDYAFLVEGLLAVHQATQEKKWLNAARRLTEQQLDLFWDERLKGCFFTALDHEKLLARPKGGLDSVIPSGNAVTARNLLRLATLTQTDSYRDKAREILELFAPELQERPGAMSTMALAVAEYVDQPDFLATEEHGRGRRSRGAAGIQLTSGANPKSNAKSNAGASPEIVTGKVYLDVDRLPAGRSCRVLVHLTIAEGWHLNANPSGSEFHDPIELSLQSKSGTKLVQLRYPRGKPFPLPESDEQIQVYEKKASLYAELAVPRAAGGATERLEVEITYMACNDKTCKPPKTITLKFDVPVAFADEEVTTINAKLFPAPRTP